MAFGVASDLESDCFANPGMLAGMRLATFGQRTCLMFRLVDLAEFRREVQASSGTAAGGNGSGAGEPEGFAIELAAFF
eukprot:14537786-Alexandrium_andersonii.AAC.1